MYKRHEPLRILHIADLQIGKTSVFEATHAITPPKGKSGSDLQAWERKNRKHVRVATREMRTQYLPFVLKDLEGLGRDLPNFLVVSGDIASTGHTFEFEVAADFLRRLVKGLDRLRDDCELPRCAGMMIVPGNHDVSYWGGRSLENFATFFDGIYSGGKKSFANPLGLLKRPFSRRTSYPSRFMTVADLRASFNVVMVGLNTCEMLDEGFRYALVSSRQIEALDQALGTLKSLPGRTGVSADATRLAVLHHNPLPFHGAEHRLDMFRRRVAAKENVRGEELLGGFFLNSSNVLAELQDRGFQLLLHGHQHRDSVKQFSAWQPSPFDNGEGRAADEHVEVVATRVLHVAGSGAFGANNSHRGDSVNRSYSVLTVFGNRRNDRGLFHVRMAQADARDPRRWGEWRHRLVFADVSRTKRHAADGPSGLNQLLLPAAGATDSTEIVLQAVQTYTEAPIVLLSKYDPERGGPLRGTVLGSNLSDAELEELERSYSWDTGETEYVFQTDPNISTRVGTAVVGGREWRVPPSTLNHGIALGFSREELGKPVGDHKFEPRHLHAFAFPIDGRFPGGPRVVALFPSDNSTAPEPMGTVNGAATICRTDFPSAVQNAYMASRVFEEVFLERIDRRYREEYLMPFPDVLEFDQPHTPVQREDWVDGLTAFAEETGRWHPAGDARGRYRERETILFVLKRKVEKLILTTLATRLFAEYRQKAADRGASEAEAIRRAECKFTRLVDELIQPPRMYAEEAVLQEETPTYDRGLHPLLVSFFLPLESNPGAAPESFGLGFFPTRDQLAWLYTKLTILKEGGTADLFPQARRFLCQEMGGHGGMMFEGFAAYVFETQQACRSNTGAAEPVVKDVHLRGWQRILEARPDDDQFSVLREYPFDDRIRARNELTNIENLLFGQGAGSDLRVLDVPVVHHGRTLAVVQIQTTIEGVIEVLAPAVMTIIQEVSVPLFLASKHQA